MNVKRSGRGIWWVVLLGGLVVAILVLISPLGAKLWRGVGRTMGWSGGERLVIKEVPGKVVTKEVEVVKEVPIPPPWVGNKTVELGKLFNGIQIKTELEKIPGKLASVERKDPGSYEVEFKVKVKVPAANKTLGELSVINPSLPKILPGLASMLPRGKVSPFYDAVYESKLRRMQSDITRLNKLLDRHNFFDTETVLELTHPAKGGRVILIQSEMDVVSDGSDGDRMPKIDDYISMSDHYQPFSSYGWTKKSTTPNPLLARWEKSLKEYEEEYKISGLSAERNKFLKDSIEEKKRGIADLKARSFLIAEAGPFIVMSLTMIRGDGGFNPGIGDYGAVIYGDKIYPVIVGDAGPYHKMGEASLRVAKELNPKATPYNRPESDLEVTYLVFPGSADKPFDAPDLEKWHGRVGQLLDGIGGVGEGYALHKWEDRFAKNKEEAVVAEPEPASAEAGGEEAPDGAE